MFTCLKGAWEKKLQNINSDSGIEGAGKFLFFSSPFSLESPLMNRY